MLGELTVKNKKKLFVYALLLSFVIGTLIRQVFLKSYHNVFICVITLILFCVPSLIDKKSSIGLPTLLEVLILVFIFACEILGEINNYYGKIPHWDTILHTINGFIMAAIGFSLIDILNKHPKFHFKLSSIFVIFFSFCFSMTIGVLWEFFEFGMDMAFGTDMQKDTVITEIHSVHLDPERNGKVVTVHVDDVKINGEDLNMGGYLDIGLIDTMKDLIVNCIGAVIFSIFGWAYLKSGGKNKLIKNLMPFIKKDYNLSPHSIISQNSN